MNKKSLYVASLILSLSLLSTLAMPVMAKKSYDKILFGCEAKGPGMLVWGRFVVPGGNPVLGWPEYVENLTKSTMNLAGISEVEVGSVEFPGGTLSGCLFKNDSVKVLGTLTASWITNDDESHTIHIVLANMEETNGLYTNGMIDSFVINHYLFVGIPTPMPVPYGHPDPENATLMFRGIYKSSCGSQEISGHGYFLVVDFEVSGARKRGVHWNLWIEELETYVTFLWSSSEGILYWDSNPAGGGTISELATIPVARALKIHIKLI